MSQRKKSNQSLSRTSGQLSQSRMSQPQPATLSESRRSTIVHHQCLILSLDPQRREMLTRAAQQGGWQPLVAADIATARKYMARMWMQLAIVDLEHAPAEESESLREFLEEVSDSNGLLLVVCGNEGDGLEEIWVRQVGAWLYLPGVNSGSDVTLLCGEAKQIAEQLHASRQFGTFVPASPTTSRAQL